MSFIDKVLVIAKTPKLAKWVRIGIMFIFVSAISFSIFAAVFF